MSEDTTRRRLITVGGATLATALAGCFGSSGGATPTPTSTTETTTMTATDTTTTNTTTTTDATAFTVRIENVAPTDFYGTDTATGGAIWVTPGAYAVHAGENPIFTVGEPASVGLEAVAEAGPPTGFEGEPGLVDELGGVERVSTVGAYTPGDTVADPNDPKGSVPGAPPIAPGGAFEFEVTAEPGERLSFASMYVPSNDLFLSPKPAIELFEDGTPVEGEVTDAVGLFDAGTELNGKPGVDPTGAPRQGGNGGPAAGATEGVVQPVSAIDDGFRYADASEVVAATLRPDGDGRFTLRIENVAPTDFYGADTATGGAIWVTPGAYAVHAGENPIFTVGEPASVGLEAVAEAGPPTGFEGEPGLVNELGGVDRVSSVGAYTPGDTVTDPNDPKGSVPGAPPIAPGGAFEVSFEATPGDRLSFASMYVPSNDLFLSPKPAIELFEDGTPVEGEVTDAVGLFDAGTELNGKPGVDPTGAPLQGRNGGPAAGATEGVVQPVDRVDDAYSYADPGETVRVTLAPQ